MKNILNRNKTLIAAIVALVATACSESFLEHDPLARESEVSFYTSFDAVDMTVTAAYSRVRNPGTDIDFIMISQGPADDIEIGGENEGDGADWKKIEQLIHTPGNPQLTANWGQTYKGIRLANTAMEKLPEYEKEEPLKVKQRMGECLFLRAFFHFKLQNLYGAVPIVPKVLNPDEFAISKSSIADVLHFVQADLEKAITMLPLRSQLGADNIGRASKGAAQALLAKAYLYESSYAKYHSGDARFAGCEQKFDKVQKLTEEIMASNEYKLVGIDGERFKSWWAEKYSPDGETIGAFRWIFSKDGDNSQEAVFEVQNSCDGRGWMASTGHALTIFTTCRYTSSNPNTMYGWGFNNATKYLLDAFRNADPREEDLSPENREVIPQRADPRFETTVGLEGDWIKTAAKGEIVAGGKTEWARMIISNVPTNTASRKYEDAPENSILHPLRGANESGEINWKLIRYADVVLMAAEAAYENGDKAKALTYVNMVRKRARLSNNDPDPSKHIYPKDLSAITFGDIVHERRIEFACEISRFFDLVRWNLAKKYIDGIELALVPGKKIKFEPKHCFLPLPMEQVQLSEGKLVQDDGWK